MTCQTCGSANAVETCYRCEAWLCEGCAQEYDGYYLCQVCYAEVTGDSVDRLDDDDFDFEEDEGASSGVEEAEHE